MYLFIYFFFLLMLPVYFSHLDLMKYFPGCSGAAKWGECLGPRRPGHSSHIRQPINSHICTEENIDGVIKLEVKLKASDGSFHFGTQYLQKTHYSIYCGAICAVDSWICQCQCVILIKNKCRTWLQCQECWQHNARNLKGSNHSLSWEALIDE